jgi:hypothetical protein
MQKVYTWIVFNRAYQASIPCNEAYKTVKGPKPCIELPLALLIFFASISLKHLQPFEAPRPKSGAI